ncbi:hypothetical protein STEG23_014314 [Scotinomys teguina]
MIQGGKRRQQRRGRRGGAGTESGVLTVTPVVGLQYQGGVHELRCIALEVCVQPQAPVLPAHPAQQGRLCLLLLPGAGARHPTPHPVSCFGGHADQLHDVGDDVLGERSLAVALSAASGPGWKYILSETIVTILSYSMPDVTTLI